MTEAPPRRVVIVVDSDERTARLVKEAIRVALRLGADLEGVFVEDEQLLALARQSFATRLEPGARRREFGAEELEREWRAQSAQVASAVERETRASAVPSHFEVRRGRARQAVRERLDAGDLVLVGWGGWAPSAGRSAPVRVLYDGGPASERALELAAELVGDDGVMAVWVRVDAEADLVPIEARLRERFAHLAGRLRIAPIRDPSAATLRNIVAASPGGLLLIPRTAAVAVRLADRSVDARFPSSVFLVGGPSSG